MPISTSGTGKCSVALSPLQTDATFAGQQLPTLFVGCYMLRPFANPAASCCKLLRVVGS